MIRRNNLLHALFFFATNLLFCLSILMFLKDADNNVFITILAIIQTIWAIIILKKYYSFFSLACLFVILSSIFHFGEAFLFAIDRADLIEYSNIALAGSMENYNIANCFALLVQSSIVVGLLLSKRNVDGRFFTNSINYIFKKTENNAILIGTITMVIGLIPTLIYYGRMISYTMAGVSYAGINQKVDIGVFSFFMNLYFPGLLVLLLALNKRNYIFLCKVFFIFAILFEFFCMLSGNRGDQITRIIVLVYLYHNCINKLKSYQILLCGIAAYFSISFLYFISSIRLHGMLSFTSNIYVGVVKNSPLLKLLAQQGSTLNIVALTIRDVPSYTPYKFGIQYLASLINMFPATSYWAGSLPSYANTLRFLNTNLPLGDSYIAELYHNFSWAGVLFAIPMGVFIGNITKKITIAINSDNVFAIAGYCVIFRGMLWVVRSNFFDFPFEFIWGVAGLAAVSLVVKRRR